MRVPMTLVRLIVSIVVIGYALLMFFIAYVVASTP